MANEVTMSTVSVDQAKMVAAKLVKRASLKMFAMSIADKQRQEKGTGLTCTFVRYKRMNLPVTALSEGVAPANSPISAETVTGTLDQWGDVVTVTDISQEATLHPLGQIAQNLLADNAARVMDREVQLVMLAGTNVQYGDGSATTRATVTQSMVITDTLIEKATLLMSEAGVETRTGPSNMSEQAKDGGLAGSLRNGSHYVAVCGGQILRDIRKVAAPSGLWQAVSQYQNAKAVYTGEIGDYLGLRLVETNFIPKFTRLGTKTVALSAGAGTITDAAGITGLTIVTANSGGSFTDAAQGFVVTRKDMRRGFEEAISGIHTIDPNSASSKFTFTFPATGPDGTANYVYGLYFTDTYGTNEQANMFLVENNILSGASVVVLDKTAGTEDPCPPVLRVFGGDPTDPDTVFPMFILGAECLVYTGMQDLKTYVVKGAEKSDPLDQTTKFGYKFMAKAVIPDETRILRLELASAFS